MCGPVIIARTAAESAPSDHSKALPHLPTEIWDLIGKLLWRRGVLHELLAQWDWTEVQAVAVRGVPRRTVRHRAGIPTPWTGADWTSNVMRRRAGEPTTDAPLYTRMIRHATSSFVLRTEDPYGRGPEFRYSQPIHVAFPWDTCGFWLGRPVRRRRDGKLVPVRTGLVRRGPHAGHGILAREDKVVALWALSVAGIPVSGAWSRKRLAQAYMRYPDAD
jgi:hypothetical protein